MLGEISQDCDCREKVPRHWSTSFNREICLQHPAPGTKMAAARRRNPGRQIFDQLRDRLRKGKGYCQLIALNSSPWPCRDIKMR